MNKRIKKALGKATAIAGLAAAVAGGAVTDDDDEISGLVQKELNNREAKIEYVDSAEPLKDAELAPAEADVLTETAVPLWRSIISVPLWIVTHIFAGLLEPIMGKAFALILLAAAITAIVCAGIKSIFPDMPLKDILSKKTLGLSLAGAAALILLDLILGSFCPSYIKWKNIFRFVFGLGIALFVIIHRSRRLAKAKPAKVVLPEF